MLPMRAPADLDKIVVVTLKLLCQKPRNQGAFMHLFTSESRTSKSSAQSHREHSSSPARTCQNPGLRSVRVLNAWLQGAFELLCADLVVLETQKYLSPQCMVTGSIRTPST